MSTISTEVVIELLNRVDPLVSKLALIAELSPLVDEAPLEDKARVSIGLLELVSDYVEQLAERARAIHEPAATLPRGGGPAMSEPRRDVTWAQLRDCWRRLDIEERVALVQCAELLLERGGEDQIAKLLHEGRWLLLGHLRLVAEARSRRQAPLLA